MTVLYTIPAGFYDFGSECVNEYDIALYERMVAARLPDEVEWVDDELRVPDDSDLLTDSAFEYEWHDLANDAWEEFCTCTGSDAAWLNAAGMYGVEVPDGYNPGWDDGTHDDRAAYGDDYDGSEDDDELTIGDILGDDED